MDTEVTDVLFRKFKDGGDIIAIFPALPGSNEVTTCSSYQHVGQHGACDPQVIGDMTVPATSDEYAALFRELTERGYNLYVIKRMTRRHFDARCKALDIPRNIRTGEEADE